VGPIATREQAFDEAYSLDVLRTVSRLGEVATTGLVDLSGFAGAFLHTLMCPCPEDEFEAKALESVWEPLQESSETDSGNTLSRTTAFAEAAVMPSVLIPGPTLMLAAVREQLHVVVKHPWLFVCWTGVINVVAYLTGGLDNMLEFSFAMLIVLLLVRLISSPPGQKEDLGRRLAVLWVLACGYIVCVVLVGMAGHGLETFFNIPAAKVRNWLLGSLSALIALNACRAASWSFGFVRIIMKVISKMAHEFGELISPDTPNPIDIDMGVVKSLDERREAKKSSSSTPK